MRKLILLNGPPRVGKDTIAEDLGVVLRQYNLSNVYYPFVQVVHEKFSKPLKDGVQAIYGVDHTIEATKDELDPRLLNTSYRNAQIALFNHLAREHGSAVLGSLFDQRVRRVSGDVIFIVSDAGRFDEIFPAIKSFDPSDAVLFRLHRSGTSFERDIRSYAVNTEIFGVKSFDVDNNDKVATCTANIISILEDVWGNHTTWQNK